MLPELIRQDHALRPAGPLPCDLSGHLVKPLGQLPRRMFDRGTWREAPRQLLNQLIAPSELAPELKVWLRPR